MSPTLRYPRQVGTLKRIRARSSEGMRKTLVAIPDSMRRRLDAIREREGLVLGECVRQALAQWLGQRRRSRRVLMK
jgi:hypothetical protein